MLYEIVWKLNEITWTSVSAVGTFIAIFSSLYLARSDRTQKIKIRPDYISGNYNEEYGTLIYIKIQNTGYRDVHIDDLIVEPPKNFREAVYYSDISLKNIFLRPSSIWYFFKSFFVSGISFTPYEFTRETSIDNSTLLPCTIKSHDSINIFIPHSYFENIIDKSENRSHGWVNIVVNTSKGKRFSEKMKVYY
ncbi:hypothetical protein [Bacillus velezensis]|uniref:hypothetical protein n=1 Tax=Bacillus velezensis TaxID=492670 RepID=UPI002DC041BB|nr:hypothetical protein [Bacillus velezensis]MEC3676875.1 hypothetical protein [Bacillus velezensis]